MIYYLDPSAWVKRYFEEAGSEAMRALFRASIDAACCRLGVVEIVATIARKSSQASISQVVVEAMLGGVRADFAAFRVVSIDEALVEGATELAIRHRLRTMDALHLASAIALRRSGHGQIQMVSSDTDLLAAASQEGLTTLNPAAAGA